MSDEDMVAYRLEVLDYRGWLPVAEGEVPKGTSEDEIIAKVEREAGTIMLDLRLYVDGQLVCMRDHPIV